jgi:uncharacterized zinc-type alcohol dehydrogenase-like protein
MTIQGHAATEPKKPLEPFSYDPGDLGAHEVEIAITHTSLCHSDIHLIDNDWGFSAYPFIPGHEIAGTVSAVGPGVREMKAGDRVGVGWQSSSCMMCEWCVRGEENACADQGGTCVGRHGGFADRVRVDSWFAHPIPDGLASEDAAPLFCAGITVYTPLRHSRVGPRSRVGVIGIGGLGHLAVQFARAFGCEVTAFSTSPDKEPEAKQLGAHHFVPSTDTDRLKKAAGSIDFLLNTTQAELDWPLWTGLLRPLGEFCQVGGYTGDIKVPAMDLILGRKSVSGSCIGNRHTMREMLEFAAVHGISPETETTSLDRVNDAIERVRSNKARYRIVMTTEGGNR